MDNPKFQIFKSVSNNLFYFRLRALNGETVLSSEGYNDKSGCLNGIGSVKTNAAVNDRYERRDLPYHFTFNLVAVNGKVIGVSEMYTTGIARENGIAAVKENAPSAPIEDLSF
jgi:uncharacterized protein YegP (UPF0339 family)